MELAILGGVAAGYTLSTDMIKLGRWLRKTTKSIRYARRDIEKVADEMIIFAELLEDFLDSCFNSKSSDEHASFSSTPLISWATSATHGLQDLLENVDALAHRSRDEYSLLETVVAHVEWYFNKSAVKHFSASLSVARESMNGFLNISCVQKLDEQLEFLRNALRDGSRHELEARLGITLEERIRALKQSRRNRRALRHEIGTRLHKAKEKVSLHQEKSKRGDFVPETKELLLFTASVEQYVEDVLPTIRSRSGTRNSRQIQGSVQNSTRKSSKQTSDSAATTSVAPRPIIDTGSTVQQSGPILVEPEIVPLASDTVDTSPPISPQSLSAQYKSNATYSQPGDSASISSVASVPSSKPSKVVKPTSPSIHHSGSPKEYINDPAGTILSPPKTKSRASPTDLKMIARVQEVLESWRVALSDSQTDELDESSEAEAMVDTRSARYRPSPFKPVAGVVGDFPPKWHQRHERSESPPDF